MHLVVDMTKEVSDNLEFINSSEMELLSDVDVAAASSKTPSFIAMGFGWMRPRWPQKRTMPSARTDVGSS